MAEAPPEVEVLPRLLALTCALRCSRVPLLRADHPPDDALHSGALRFGQAAVVVAGEQRWVEPALGGGAELHLAEAEEVRVPGTGPVRAGREGEERFCGAAAAREHAAGKRGAGGVEVNNTFIPAGPRNEGAGLQPPSYHLLLPGNSSVRVRGWKSLFSGDRTHVSSEEGKEV